MSTHYKQSGVDVEAGDNLVSWLQSTAPKDFPHKDKVVSGIGGFASLFRVDFSQYKKPCLVSGTDGVGTKLKLAFQYESYDTVAYDLVGMCVNDVLTVGAEPLFFLDYFATGKLEPKIAQKFLTGLRAACQEAGVALVGGETAEMPGFYHPNEFDVAGFALGIVDEEKALGAHRTQSGQLVLGISSSGFHSNGYSLVRRVFENDSDNWKDSLLKPTHLYSNLVKSWLNDCEPQAMAHITGGGFENVPRVFNSHLGLKLNTWEFPLIFQELQARTKMSSIEMLKTLNCGIGWVGIFNESHYQKAKLVAETLGFQTYNLGTLEPGTEIDYSNWSSK